MDDQKKAPVAVKSPRLKVEPVESFARVGSWLGEADGDALGLIDGDKLGDALGLTDGLRDGEVDGLTDGDNEGLNDALSAIITPY